jgi:hypothetical protein
MKLRNKLILSCAALAAVATTAFSTTFAWYTANDSVKATGITGKTSDADDTLLLISKTGKQGTWGAKVAIDTDAAVLEPVAYNSTDKKYYLWDGSNNAVDATSEAAACHDAGTSGQYISFVLYFKSGSSQDLNVNVDTITLTNTDAAALPAKTVLAAGTGSTNTTYTINMFRALKFTTIVGNGTEIASNSTAQAAEVPSTATRTTYKLDSLVAAGSDSYTTTGTSASNAHTYYNNVKSLTGSDAIDTSKDGSGETEVDFTATGTGFGVNGFNVGHTGAGAAADGAVDNLLAVQFDIWLDGWDNACFDACRNQHFTLEMTFGASNYTA